MLIRFSDGTARAIGSGRANTASHCIVASFLSTTGWFSTPVFACLKIAVITFTTRLWSDLAAGTLLGPTIDSKTALS